LRRRTGRQTSKAAEALLQKQFEPTDIGVVART
jgi:hypothetical protein